MTTPNIPTAAAAARNNSIVAARENNNAVLNANAAYSIKVYRPTSVGPGGGFFNQGYMEFQHGALRINTPCWWSKKRVDPGVYIATATRMDNRLDGRTKDGNGITKREGIFLLRKISFGAHNIVQDLPDVAPLTATPLPANNGTTTADGVFIHKGKEPENSIACIVADESQVFNIWNTVLPKNEENVIVYVYDYEPVGDGPMFQM
ncbi:hypothetical protein [Pelagibius sp. Alg239-R121]|uniref:hypothetical protein n=1 Tax=Pelagibius sp. Alg239-R121 TaxID=2993448 RepID=UPI0024A6D765|nr:hypothetical protein [Pelagibius sp. Alg239-R121]